MTADTFKGVISRKIEFSFYKKSYILQVLELKASSTFQKECYLNETKNS